MSKPDQQIATPPEDCLVIGYAVTLSNEPYLPSPATQCERIIKYCEQKNLLFDPDSSLIVEAIQYGKYKHTLNYPGVQHVLATAPAGSHLVFGHMRAFRTIRHILTVAEAFQARNITLAIVDMPWLDMRYNCRDALTITNNFIEFDRNVTTIKQRPITAPIGWRWTRELMTSGDNPYKTSLIPCIRERKIAIDLSILHKKFGNSVSLTWSHAAKDPQKYSLRGQPRVSLRYVSMLLFSYFADFPKIMPRELEQARIYMHFTRETCRTRRSEEEIRNYLRDHPEFFGKFSVPAPSEYEWTLNLANTGTTEDPVPCPALEQKIPKHTLGTRMKHTTMRRRALSHIVRERLVDRANKEYFSDPDNDPTKFRKFLMEYQAENYDQERDAVLDEFPDGYFRKRKS